MSETPTDSPRLVTFGVYELDLHSGELRKSGSRLALQQQPLQLLSVLIERPGELVTREDLRKRLWPDWRRRSESRPYAAQKVIHFEGGSFYVLPL